MIKNGNKREEYREIKPYWMTRLFNIDKKTKQDKQFIIEEIKNHNIQPKDFTHVKFRKGYTNDYIIFRIENITIGVGNKEWGAPTNDIFIIKFANQTLKEEFTQTVTKTLIAKENEYSENDNIDLNKVTDILTNELRMFFSDSELNFKSNDNQEDFTLLPSDEHTKEILKTIE